MRERKREGAAKMLWLPFELVEQVDELREPLGLTFRAVVIAALWAWVKKMRKEIERE